MAGADDTHGCRAAVLLVVGVEDEEDVHRALEDRVDLVVVADLPHHREEVGGEREVVVGVVEGQADREAVAHGRDGRCLGDQSEHLLAAGLGVAHLFRPVVEGSERCHRRDEHAHRVGVVVEAVHEALAHVLVDEGVVGDVVGPGRELLGGGELPVEQQVGDLQEGRALRELLDRIAAVAEDPGSTVEIGHGGSTRGGLHVGGVVDEQRGVEIADGAGREDTPLDRYGHGLAAAVVGDGDGLRHGGFLGVLGSQGFLPAPPTYLRQGDRSNGERAAAAMEERCQRGVFP